MNFVFDMDGTVCFDGMTIDNRLTSFLAEEIHQQDDHQLVFASARPVRDMLPLLPKELKNCHLIGSNGAMHYSGLEAKWFETIKKEDASYIREYVSHKQLDYLFDDKWNYACQGDTLSLLRSRLDILKKAQNVSITDVHEPVKILVSNYLNETELMTDFAHLGVDCNIYPTERCLDVTKTGVNKASAIERVLDGASYIAFGNDRNDKEMLRQASFGVGVGNSQEIKELANTMVDENPLEIIQQVKQILAS